MVEREGGRGILRDRMEGMGGMGEMGGRERKG